MSLPRYCINLEDILDHIPDLSSDNFNNFQDEEGELRSVGFSLNNNDNTFVFNRGYEIKVVTFTFHSKNYSNYKNSGHGYINVYLDNDKVYDKIYVVGGKSKAISVPYQLDSNNEIKIEYFGFTDDDFLVGSIDYEGYAPLRELTLRHVDTNGNDIIPPKHMLHCLGTHTFTASTFELNQDGWYIIGHYYETVEIAESNELNDIVFEFTKL